jgi:hypothetical protein
MIRAVVNLICDFNIARQSGHIVMTNGKQRLTGTEAAESIFNHGWTRIFEQQTRGKVQTAIHRLPFGKRPGKQIRIQYGFPK